MLKIYKSGALELSDETIHIDNTVQTPLRDEQNGVSTAEQAKPTISAQEQQAIERAEQMVTQAQMQAQAIYQQAQEQGNKEKMSIIQQAQYEAAQIRQRAYEEGLKKGIADGYAEKTAAISECICNLENVIPMLEGKLEGFLFEYEENLQYAVLEIAEKVLNHAIEEDELEMLDLVRGAVNSVRDEQWLDVQLSRDSLELIDRLEREFAPLDNVTVVPQNVPVGSCIIDMPNGKLDASVYAQLRNIKEYLTVNNIKL